MPQTTTCCYYGTLHLEATKILANIVHSYGEHSYSSSSLQAHLNRPSHPGQRAFVGVRDIYGNPYTSVWR
jgi:hypothetical protein